MVYYRHFRREALYRRRYPDYQDRIQSLESFQVKVGCWYSWWCRLALVRTPTTPASPAGTTQPAAGEPRCAPEISELIFVDSMRPGSKVLYLGAASGTSVSHVAGKFFAALGF